MSVKNKVKRCNKEIKKLNYEKGFLELKLEMKNNDLKRISEDYEKDLRKLKLYENIIKFAITNQIGGLRGGIMVDYYGIDKMNVLKLFIEEIPIEHSYKIRVDYH